MERKKLLAEHQRHIEDELAKKKTSAMNDYLDALAADQPDVSSLAPLSNSTSRQKHFWRQAASQGGRICHGEKFVWHRPVGSNAVVLMLLLIFAAYTASVTHIAFQLARQPPKLRLLLGDLNSNLTHDSLGPLDPCLPSNLHSRSLKPSLHSLSTCSTDRQTHRQTTLLRL